MATKDWKKVEGRFWVNKKNKNNVNIEKSAYERIYYVMVTESGIVRQYDNALTTLKDAYESAKTYMRLH